MPPVTAEEQGRCMQAAAGCWRFAQPAATKQRQKAAAAS
jgi:hypothetical protein